MRYLNVNEELCEEDTAMILEMEEENLRLGGYERIFPVKQTVDYYEKLFEQKRYNNILLWAYLRSGSPLSVINQSMLYKTGQLSLET
jgi:hypothetical protein